MHLIDTHCHIHDSEMLKRYDVTQLQLLDAARVEGVKQLIMIGTDIQSSREAVVFASKHEDCYAALAIHPHEAAKMNKRQLQDVMHELRGLYAPKSKIVAIGECGLDYYYHDDQEIKDRQKALFRTHIELALSLELPLSFHIRNAEKTSSEHSAFDDFFSIVDEYDGVKGVVHSFTAGKKEMEGCVQRGLYIGLNGIMTFTHDQGQLDAAKAAPLESIVLETDAPFLTPAPFRGKMCEPKHVRVTAEFLSQLRGESMKDFSQATTRNAQSLFQL